jgi:hypothetical protein
MYVGCPEGNVPYFYLSSNKARNVKIQMQQIWSFTDFRQTAPLQQCLTKESVNDV